MYASIARVTNSHIAQALKRKKDQINVSLLVYISNMFGRHRQKGTGSKNTKTQTRASSLVSQQATGTFHLLPSPVEAVLQIARILLNQPTSMFQVSWFSFKNFVPSFQNRNKRTWPTTDQFTNIHVGYSTKLNYTSSLLIDYIYANNSTFYPCPSRIMCISMCQVNSVVRDAGVCIPCREQSVCNISGLSEKNFVPWEIICTEESTDNSGFHSKLHDISAKQVFLSNLRK